MHIIERNIAKLAYILFAAMFLFSCSNSSPTVEPQGTTTDTPGESPGTDLMTVALASPTNGSSSVRSDTNIIISFSDVVSSSTLSGKISIVGSSSGTHTYTGIGSDSSVYSLAPATAFDNSETVTVTITSTTVSPIESTGGTDLYRGATGSESDTYYEFQFTTAASTDTQPSESLVVVPDSQNPAPGVANISIDTDSIYVAFSDDAIVQYTNYTITGSTSGDVRTGTPTAVNGIGTIWKLPINTPLAYGETVTVTLSTGITDDTAVIPLTQDGEHMWTFTTETSSAAIPGTVTITSIYVNNLTSAGAGSATATVHWTTNQPISGSTVNYDTSTAYSSATSEAAGSYDVHSVTLSSLNENSLYYYQIDSGGVTATGTFFTTNSNPSGSNPGSPAYTSAYDSSDITMVQNENGGSFDASSYMFWLNNSDVYGILFATNGSVTWTNTIDTGTVTDVEAVSDGYGSALVAMEDAGGIRATLVDNTGSTTYLNSGSAVSTGSAPSVAIVWGGQGDNNVDGGFITYRTNGTSVVFADDANYIYDYDYDLRNTGIMGTTDGDIIFNQNLLATNSNNTTVTNISGITASYRHVIDQTADIVNSGETYHIADVSSAYGPYPVMNHDIYESSPEGSAFTYYNPTTGEILDDIYSPYTPAFSSAQAVADHIVKITDDSTNSYFRRLVTPTDITFGTSTETHLHAEYYSGNTSETSIAKLIAYGTDFTSGYAVQVGDLVENSTGGYAEVTDITNAASGELVLSSDIFSSSSESYTIYSLSLLISGTSSGDSNQVYDDTLTSPNFIDYLDAALTDIVENTDNSTYSTISSFDSINIWLNSPIMNASPITTNYAAYTPTSERTGTTSVLLIDTGVSFNSDGNVSASDIVEDTTDTSFARIVADYEDALVIDTDIFGAGETYVIYNGLYNYTGYSSDMFSGFVHLALDSNTATISDNANQFTIYNSLDFSGSSTLYSTADSRPANPLFDDTGVFVTSSVADNDAVFNTSAWTFTRVETTPFSVKERALDLVNDIFTTDGHLYSIFTFNPDVPDADIIAIGSAITPGNPFTDSWADFSVAGVKKGDLIYNITDRTYAVVNAVTSSTQLTLNKNIMNTVNDSYAVFRSNEYILEAGAVTTAGTTFEDTYADFISSNVQVGDIVHNQTDGTEGAVTAIVSATRLTLTSNIMNDIGDRYVILQPRALFVYENGGGIYATLVNLRDGSLYDQDYDGDNTNDEITIAAAGSNPHVISDSQGNAFIVYENGGTIYVRRSNGNCSTITGSYSITGTILDVKNDNSNGIYLLYQNGASVGIDRLSTPAASAWGGSVTWTGTGAVMAVDPSGDPTLAFVDASPDIQLRGLRQSDGSAIASNTILTSGYTYLTTITALSITADQSDSGGTDSPGGSVVTWADDRYYSSYGFGIYAQAVDDSGSLVWNTDSSGTDYTGVTVGISSAIDNADILTKSVFYNDSGTPYGGLILWLDYRDGYADIYYNTLAR